jgi:toxin ParE1/3/4
MATSVNNYDLSSLARLDLRKIWVFTAEKWGRRKATEYLQEISAMINLIALDHGIGFRFDPLDPECRRVLIGSHAVIYRVTDGRLRIIRILHQAMDTSTHLN